MTTAGVAHRRYSKDAGNPMRCDDWFRSYDEKTCTNAAIGSEQLRDAIVQTGQSLEPDQPRRRLTFEEQLALVALGRARIIEV